MFLRVLNPEIVDATRALPDLIPLHTHPSLCSTPATKLRVACGKQHFAVFSSRVAIGFGNAWYDQIFQENHAENHDSDTDDDGTGNASSPDTSAKRRYIKGVVFNLDGIRTVFACGDQTFLLLNDRRTVVSRGCIYENITKQFPTVIRSIACGKTHVLALGKDKKVYGWGGNANGQLGKSVTLENHVEEPLLLSEHGEVDHIAANYHMSVLLKESPTSTVSHTLGGKQPELLHGKRRKLPWKSKVSQVACGENHVLLLFEDGKLCSWGSNQYGQLGLTSVQNPYQDRSYPAMISSRFSPVRTKLFASISAAKRHSLAVTRQGEVFRWGWTPPCTCRHRPEKVFTIGDKVKGKRAVCRSAFAGEDYSVLFLQHV